MSVPESPAGSSDARPDDAGRGSDSEAGSPTGIGAESTTVSAPVSATDPRTKSTTDSATGSGPLAAAEERSNPDGRLARLQRFLNEPVDAASVEVFRLAFGLIIAFECLRYLQLGVIHSHFIEPEVFFRYPGFGWLPAPPAWLVVPLWSLVGLAALALGLGFRPRSSSALFTVGFGAFFFLDRANYLNHFYFVLLLGGLLSLLPTGRLATPFRRGGAETCPRGLLWMLRFQIALPYIYGGVAKINVDWMQGQPLARWLSVRAEIPLVGPVLALPETALVMSWAGLLLDLLCVPALLWRRTRWPAAALIVSFHCMNAWLFSIGIFPWLMLAASSIFLPPDWPRVAGFLPARPDGPRRSGHEDRLATPLLALLGLWVLWQILMPLRHHLIPGPVVWTEEGHRWSWRMKLRDKHPIPLRFTLHRDGEAPTELDPARRLTPRQVRKMLTRPGMLREWARLEAGRARRADPERRPVRITANLLMSVNGRAPQRFVKAKLDLAGATGPDRELLAPFRWTQPGIWPSSTLVTSGAGRGQPEPPPPPKPR